MKRIRNKTYSNFIYVFRKIKVKGYDDTEAEKITHQLFDQLNPKGISMNAMIDQIVTYDEWVAMKEEGTGFA